MVFRMCQRVCGSWSSVHLGNAPAPYPRPRLSSRCRSAGGKNAAVDHQILVFAVRCQRFEHPSPHAGMPPAAEAPVHRLSLAVLFRTFALRCVGRNAHSHRLMTGGYPHPSGRDQPPYPVPLSQSASTAPRSTHTALSPSPTSHLDRDAYESAFRSPGDQALSGLIRSDRRWRCKEGPRRACVADLRARHPRHRSSTYPAAGPPIG